MTGLTNEQVKARMEEGLVNVNENPNTRSFKQIILENTLTFFNFLNIVLFVLMLMVGSYKNCTFMGVIAVNTIIGIVQEIRAKREIDKLVILTESKTIVIRDGKKWAISTEKLVKDDLIILKTGDQVPADAVIMEGSLEVNESLLTGEADNLLKEKDAELFSGSFVTAGTACCKVIHVGKENYASKITSEAKEFKRHNSELRNSLNAILKVISIIIVPLGALLFYKQHFIAGESVQVSVVSTVAAVIGMIPEGLVLLTSISLTLGSMVLAKKKTLVQELYCIETLARVDTLCLDKTGTITEGSMCVEEVIPYGETELNDTDFIMRNVMAALTDENATADALRKHFGTSRDLPLVKSIPFSSDRKYSGAVFEGKGTYLVGAAQFLFPEKNEELLEQCAAYTKKGLRVLVLAHSEEVLEELCLPQKMEVKAFLLLTDVIRPEAPETLAFFHSQGVDLKVISGDDPVTVAAIAKKAGLLNAEKYVDATTLQTEEEIENAVKECSVFGRVTPQQKKAMVQALKKQGHSVAMTGDGVNDVLALKEADCSIAMAQGSDAAKNVANVVLLDSNFASMPHIVNQGRRVVNNIRAAASMFLIKTILSVCLSLLTIFFGSTYPFEPIQMTLISACAVGIPTFLLAQENNYTKIGKTFLRHVFMNAFPAAVTISGCVFAIMLVCDYGYHSTEMLGTACVLVTGWNYMAALRTVYSPLNRYRKIVIYGMQFVFFIAAVVFQELLVLGPLEFNMLVLVFLLMIFTPVAIDAITAWLRKLYDHALDSENPNRFVRFLNRVQGTEK